MSQYTPDAWVIVKISSKEHGSHYRVMAGWYGGFAGSDSWKMNSGIVGYTEDEYGYHFYGESGSVYHCNRNIERFTGYMRVVFDSFVSDFRDEAKGSTLEHIDFAQFALDFKP